jgi:hypothetical protein
MLKLPISSKKILYSVAVEVKVREDTQHIHRQQGYPYKVSNYSKDAKAKYQCQGFP